MENQSIKDGRKAKLPPLLSGSEYKTDDGDIHRGMNLLGLAITIVVYAEKNGVSGDCKKAWLTSFEKEYKRAQLYHKKTINFNARHSSHITPIPDDTGCASPIYKMTFDWLRRSLLDSPNWERLYQLIKIQTTWLRNDPSADWWNKVQSICRKVETAVDPLDPIAEIWRITQEYRTEDELAAQSDRARATADEPLKKGGWRNVGASVVSLIVILLFELFVYIAPVSYVRNHPHSYGIQGSIICLILCLIVGFLNSRWRKWCWGSAAIAFLVALLSLL